MEKLPKKSLIARVRGLKDLFPSLPQPFKHTSELRLKPQEDSCSYKPHYELKQATFAVLSPQNFPQCQGIQYTTDT